MTPLYPFWGRVSGIEDPEPFVEPLDDKLIEHKLLDFDFLFKTSSPYFSTDPLAGLDDFHTNPLVLSGKRASVRVLVLGYLQSNTYDRRSFSAAMESFRACNLSSIFRLSSSNR